MSQKINVDIITEYKGAQKLKTAQKDLGSFEQSLNKLGKKFAEVFAAEKLLQFGKASVEAFAADQKSAAILTNTLGNLGQAFANVPVETFITKLSELNGIAKTDLRNSFDTLVRSTGDAAKAQDLLSLGTDISAGTGKDLATVTTALAKAYGGNYAALSKLGAGVSKALLSTKDFAKMQKFLAQTFKGDASVAADSYQGKINRLKTSFEEFKITVGSGLVDAFANLGKGSNVEGFQNSMSVTATNIADMVDGLGKILDPAFRLPLGCEVAQAPDDLPRPLGLLGDPLHRREPALQVAGGEEAPGPAQVIGHRGERLVHLVGEC